MTLIRANQGNNAIQKGANVGQQVANLARNNPQALNYCDIQYTTQENGKFSIDGGLAYSMESLKAFDFNGDGIVTTQETGQLGQLIDLNNDGKISASENLAYTMYQDAAGNMDGVVTAQERDAANRALMADPAKARSQMQQLSNGHNLQAREQQLTQQNSNAQNNPMMQMMQAFMQMFMQIIQQMMQMFGMAQ
ncbi:MAG: hypothetical protein AB7V50_08785 [Vampirovibrionia bacterium]